MVPVALFLCVVHRHCAMVDGVAYTLQISGPEQTSSWPRAAPRHRVRGASSLARTRYRFSGCSEKGRCSVPVGTGHLPMAPNLLCTCPLPRAHGFELGLRRKHLGLATGSSQALGPSQRRSTSGRPGVVPVCQLLALYSLPVRRLSVLVAPTVPVSAA